MLRKNKKLIFLLLILIILFIIFYINSTGFNYKNVYLESAKGMNGEPIDKETGLINNRYFNINAQGKNAKETTEGINKAIEYAYNNNINYLKLEKGSYSIDGQSFTNQNESDEKKGIILQSNITIDLNGSELKQIANDKVNYAIISITEVENVKINNGKIIGDQENHQYTDNSTHEWGFGIDIRGSENIEISNLEIQDCTGDGIIITNYKDYNNISENIKINNLHIHDCRRQGISIIAAQDVVIENNELYNISGTAPQSGIDLESWDSKQIIDKIYIKNNKIYNTKNSYAVIVMGNSKNVYVEENLITGIISCENIKEKITIRNNKVINGTISLGVTSDDLIKGKVIKKAVIKNNDLQNSNLYLLNAENVLVEENIITDKGIMCFDSNACFYNNTISNQKETYMQTGMYIRNNNKESQNSFHLYICKNIYSGNITKQEDIEETKNIVIHRDEEEVLNYIKEFD